MTTNQHIRTSSTITRRAALRGTAAVAAVGIPAGAAVASVDQLIDTDQHIAWWRERQRLSREIDEAEGLPHEDALVDRQLELDNLIVGTQPTTLEGAAIVATALVWWQNLEEQTPGWGDIDKEAGGTLARYFLAGLPTTVLRRAGLEGVA